MTEAEKPEPVYAFQACTWFPCMYGGRVKETLPNGEVHLVGDSSGFSMRPTKLIVGARGKALLSRLTRLQNKHNQAMKDVKDDFKAQARSLLGEFEFTEEEIAGTAAWRKKTEETP